MSDSKESDLSQSLLSHNYHTYGQSADLTQNQNNFSPTNTRRIELTHSLFTSSDRLSVAPHISPPLSSSSSSHISPPPLSSSSLAHANSAALNAAINQDFYVRIGAFEQQYDASNHWNNASPFDLFVHIFSYLTPSELTHASLVNQAWCRAAYEPTLYLELDLSNMYNKIDDAFLHQLLKSKRFIRLQSLSLEGCSAITNKSVKTLIAFCPNIKEIRLTNCTNITNPWIFIELVRACLYLKKLEIYNITREFSIVPPILKLRPRINLGFFWLEYCAEMGLKLDGSGLESCRYENRVHAGDRGCWGRVKGRLVHSNTIYQRAGNYPADVLFSCENHAQEDYKQEEYIKCEMCNLLFQQPSMFSPLICKVCVDEEVLHMKRNWIPLDNISRFSFSDVLHRTVHIADRRNLPTSLRSYGTQECKLDYSLPDIREVGLQHAVDSTQVPLHVFLEHNQTIIDDTVHNLKRKLHDAKKHLNTRALLCYDSNDNIELFADRRVILDGREGEEHMQLTNRAWTQALEIIYAIVTVVVIVCHFSILFQAQLKTSYNGKSNYTAYISNSNDGAMSSLLVLIIAAGAFLLLLIFIILIWRFREQCERCFKRFLVADIFMIFAFGIGSLLWLLITELQIYFDALTFSVVLWNLSGIGIVSLYFDVPKRVHQFYLIILNSIMAIMIVSTLTKWFILGFIFIAAIGDIISELRPNLRLLSPFIIPTDVELIYNTPKILYIVGGLRLRAADLMWYGLLMGLAVQVGNGGFAGTILTATLIFVCILSSIAILLFVAPFVGVRFRPLPAATILTFLTIMLLDPVIKPYISQQSSMLHSPIYYQ